MKPGGPGNPARDLAELLAKQHEAGKTGIVTATRAKQKRLLCLEEGWLVFVASNVKEEQFGEHLVNQKLLSPDKRAAASKQARDQKKKLPAVLVETGIVSEDKLRTAMEEQIRSLLCSCLEWPDGEFRFQTGQPDLEGEVKGRLSPVRMILDYTRTHPSSLDVLRVRLGRPDARPQALSAKIPLVESEDIGEVGNYLLRHCSGTRQLAELVGSSPAEPEPTLRMLYALMLLGVTIPAEDVAEAAFGEEDRPASREEVLARLTKAEGADHYLVLGIERGATHERIRDAYYMLARRLHPDRFRSGKMSDLLPRMEVYFSQVTEAYNTLYDLEERERYDERLDAATREAEAPSESEKSFLARQNYLRGKELAERKRYAEAQTFLENAVQLDPTQSVYFFELGLLLSHNPRMRFEAEKRLRRVTELEPASTRAYLALGELYRRSQRMGEAVQMYREVLRWDPDNARAQRRLKELKAGGRKSLFKG